MVLDLSQKNDLNRAPVVRLADRFAPHVDAELLKEEWDDFKLLDEGAVSMVDAKGKQQKLDKVWSEVISMNTSWEYSGSQKWRRCMRSCCACLTAMPTVNSILNGEENPHRVQKEPDADILTACVSAVQDKL